MKREWWKKKRFFVPIILGLLLISYATWFVSTPYAVKEIDFVGIAKEFSLNFESNRDFISIKPKNESKTAIIFYPGGRVTPESYINLMSIVAFKANINVYILKAPLNLAILNVLQADGLTKSNLAITEWYLSGHSLGGVAASVYLTTQSYPDSIKGIIYCASYPATDWLKNKNLRVLSIRGSKDGLAKADVVESSKNNLPSHSKFVTIDGMNHSEFGNYGLQSGDNPPDLTYEQAWNQVANEIDTFINE